MPPRTGSVRRSRHPGRGTTIICVLIRLDVRTVDDRRYTLAVPLAACRRRRYAASSMPRARPPRMAGGCGRVRRRRRRPRSTGAFPSPPRSRYAAEGAPVDEHDVDGASRRAGRQEGSLVVEDATVVARVLSDRRRSADDAASDRPDLGRGSPRRSRPRPTPISGSPTADGAERLPVDVDLRGASRRDPTRAAAIQTGTSGSSNSLCGACESAWTSRTRAPRPLRGSAPARSRAGGAPRARPARSRSRGSERGQRTLAVPPLRRAMRSSRGSEAARSSRGSCRRARRTARASPASPKAAERIGHDAPVEVVGRAPDEAVAHGLHERGHGDRGGKRLAVDRQLRRLLRDRDRPLRAARAHTAARGSPRTSGPRSRRTTTDPRGSPRWTRRTAPGSRCPSRRPRPRERSCGSPRDSRPRGSTSGRRRRGSRTAAA